MSKLIYINSLNVLVVVLFWSSFSGKAICASQQRFAIALMPSTPNISRRLVADLSNTLPPAKLPSNPRATVTVPPLNRPASAKPNQVIVPTIPTPAVRIIPRTTPTKNRNDVSVPQIIQFGQPLPRF